MSSDLQREEHRSPEAGPADGNAAHRAQNAFERRPRALLEAGRRLLPPRGILVSEGVVHHRSGTHGVNRLPQGVVQRRRWDAKSNAQVEVAATPQTSQRHRCSLLNCVPTGCQQRLKVHPERKFVLRHMHGALKVSRTRRGRRRATRGEEPECFPQEDETPHDAVLPLL